MRTTPRPKGARVLASLALGVAAATASAAMPAQASATTAPTTSPTTSPTTASASVSKDLSTMKRIVQGSVKTRVTALHQRLATVNDLNPGDYQCSSTPVNDWVEAQYNRMNADEEAFYWGAGLSDIVTYDAVFNGTTQAPGYVVTDHQHQVYKTFSRLQSFWNLHLPNLQLVGMNGSILTDRTRLQAFLATVWQLDTANAADLAAAIVDFVTTDPVMANGTYALISFNAFLVTPDSLPGLTEPKIVLGDGLLRGQDANGLGDVAPQFILGHEYTHAMQAARGGILVEAGATPETTRYSELMADAGSAYFNSHPKGNSMQAKRIAEFAATAWNAGDCGFDSIGFHGTPNERRNAAEFGAALQEADHPKSRILTFEQFKAAYDAQYATIVAPDA